jgi:hypothetical protein
MFHFNGSVCKTEIQENTKNPQYNFESVLEFMDDYGVDRHLYIELFNSSMKNSECNLVGKSQINVNGFFYKKKRIVVKFFDGNYKEVAQIEGIFDVEPKEKKKNIWTSRK